MNICRKRRRRRKKRTHSQTKHRKNDIFKFVSRCCWIKCLLLQQSRGEMKSSGSNITKLFVSLTLYFQAKGVVKLFSFKIDLIKWTILIIWRIFSLFDFNICYFAIFFSVNPFFVSLAVGIFPESPPNRARLHENVFQHFR